jgi:hypothetical protein
MEVLLNTTWLLVAIGAFLFWQVETESICWRREHSRRYRFLCLTVVLILLLPVISLTDDLHAEQTAMEDSSRAVMKAKSTLQGCLRAGGAPFVATVANTQGPVAALRPFLGTVMLVERPLRTSTPVSAHDGRSPPLLAS